MSSLFDRTAIRAVRTRYDLRKIYPTTPHRRRYQDHVRDFCIFHSDKKNPNCYIWPDHGHCFACGTHFDIIDLYRRENPGASMAEAIEQLGNGGTTYRPSWSSPQLTNPPPPPEPYHEEVIMSYVEAMSDQDYARLEEDTGITEGVARYYQIGLSRPGIYTIPILFRGDYVEIFFYNPRRLGDAPKYWRTQSGNWPFGADDLNPQVEEGWILEGLHDGLIGKQDGLNCFTLTCGATSFRPEWGELLVPYRNVYILFDNNPAGRIGARKAQQAIRRAVIVDWRLLTPLPPHGFDYYNFRSLGHSPNDDLHDLATRSRRGYWSTEREEGSWINSL